MGQEISKSDYLDSLKARRTELLGLVDLFGDKPNNAGFVEELRGRIAEIDRQILIADLA